MALTFDEYQALARTTAIYPRTFVESGTELGGWPETQVCNLMYPALGISGEAGEVAEKVKKIVRDSNGAITDDHKAALRKELGDILWYVSALASELDLEMGDIAQANYDKLKSRQERNKLKGSGDDR